MKKAEIFLDKQGGNPYNEQAVSRMTGHLLFLYHE